MEHTSARILYVDPHQDTRLVMMLLLQREGYGVMTASTIAEGMELAGQVPFDLYLLETRLPDGTGIELCQRLHELTPDVPVLYYTPSAHDADQINALSKCGHEYLKKPVCFADIREAVLRLLISKERSGAT